MATPINYEQAGVNIAVADAAKEDMAVALKARDSRVLNGVGAFASLFDISYPELRNPVLVLKMEEPGSKQLLAAQHGRLSSIGYDLVNHLINDTIMMGARPLAILDTIVCGKLEREAVVGLVRAMAEACRVQGCSLVGGETSEQPRVLPAGSYILGAACAGIVDRARVIDGSAIKDGDAVFAVASSGVHTNGYTLIRSLLDADPGLKDQRVAEMSFLDAVLVPHRCYNQPLQRLFAKPIIHGLAHITGGGIVDNTERIVPEGLTVSVNLEAIQIHPVFSVIRRASGSSDQEMIKTFNLGVGMMVIAPESSEAELATAFENSGDRFYRIGSVQRGTPRVSLSGALRW